ncbi:hypothetical protein [Dyella solisilvae]|nr:hypothetical protein [Dyella solisilvae]
MQASQKAWDAREPRLAESCRNSLLHDSNNGFPGLEQSVRRAAWLGAEAGNDEGRRVEPAGLRDVLSATNCARVVYLP